MSQQQEFEDRKELLKSAMNILDERETDILKARRLSENPKTLEELSTKFKISRRELDKLKLKLLKSYKNQ